MPNLIWSPTKTFLKKTQIYRLSLNHMYNVLPQVFDMKIWSLFILIKKDLQYYTILQFLSDMV